MHALGATVALLPLHQEFDAVVEPGVEEQMVQPLEQLRRPPRLHGDGGEGVPQEVAMGGARGGAEESRPSSRRSGYPKEPGHHYGDGGGSLP